MLSGVLLKNALCAVHELPFESGCNFDPMLPGIVGVADCTSLPKMYNLCNQNESSSQAPGLAPGARPCDKLR